MELLLLLEAAHDVDQMVQIEFAVLAGRVRRKAGSTYDGVRGPLVVRIDTAAFTFIDCQIVSPAGRMVDGRRDGGRGHWGRNGRRRSVRRHHAVTRFHREVVGAAGRVLDRVEELSQIDANRMRAGRVTVLVFHPARAVPALDGRETFVANAAAGVGRRRRRRGSGRSRSGCVRMKVLSGNVDLGTCRTATPGHPAVSFLVIFDIILVGIAALDVDGPAESRDPM